MPSIENGTVVVGAENDDDAGSAAGSAYVFRTSDGGATYGQVAKLTAQRRLLRLLRGHRR